MGFAFSLPSEGFVQIKVYDSTGRRVRTLLSAEMSAGTYSARWDGRDQAGRPVAPGIYFYELRANGERLSRRVSLMR
jgi:flagellar hook assembly protein FlgD